MADRVDPPFEVFLRGHPVFRKGEFEALGMGDRARGVLGRLKTRGRLISLRNGLYACLDHFPSAESIDPWLVAGRAAANAVIGFEAALLWHTGRQDQLRGPIHVFSTELRADRKGKQKLSAHGIIPVLSKFAPGPEHLGTEVSQIELLGLPVLLTSPERTLVDVLDRQDLAADEQKCRQTLQDLAGPLRIEVVCNVLRRMGCKATLQRVGDFLSRQKRALGLSARDLRPLQELIQQAGVPFNGNWDTALEGGSFENAALPMEDPAGAVSDLSMEAELLEPRKTVGLNEASAGASYGREARLAARLREPQLDLGESRLIEELQLRFSTKFRSFRPGQEAIIRAVLEGRDALAFLPTGAGKSLTFQFPALLLNGITVVNSPLVSLIEDQIREARERGLLAVAYGPSSRNGLATPVRGRPRKSPDSNRTPAVRPKEDLHSQIWFTGIQLAERIEARPPHLLFATPEGVLKLIHQLPALRSMVRLVVVDEAHLIHSWGRSFRMDYQRLGIARRAFPLGSVLALTATATQEARDSIVRSLGFQPGSYEEQRFSVYRSRLFLRTQELPRGNFKTRFSALWSFLSGRLGEPGLVFCQTRKQAQRVALQLKGLLWEKGKASIKVSAYHAGLPASKRKEIQDSFLVGKCHIVVATVAFGMGVNKPDVRWVVHFGLPSSLTGYVQEIGRAGRDGSWATCLLLHSRSDEGHWTSRLRGIAKKRLEQQPEPDLDPWLDWNQRELATMVQFTRSNRCMHQMVGEHFGENQDACGGSCAWCLGSLEPLNEEVHQEGDLSRPQEALSVRSLAHDEEDQGEPWTDGGSSRGEEYESYRAELETWYED